MSDKNEILEQFHSSKIIREVKTQIAAIDKLENDAKTHEWLLNIVKYAFNEVDLNHEWSVQWKKIRNIIVLGRDKHDYFANIADYEEDALEDTNKWLEENKFSGLHPDYVELGTSCGIEFWVDEQPKA